MQRSLSRVFVLSLIAAYGHGCGPAPPAVCRPGGAACADPPPGEADSAAFASPTTFNGFVVSATGPAFYHLTAGAIGLQFPATGLEIVLPSPSCEVTIEGGGWAGNITATALDPAGATVASLTTPSPDQIHTLVLAGHQITRVILKDGGNEGMLFSVRAIP